MTDTEVSWRTGVNCRKLTLCTLCSVATQHDTCPVCRKSLNGEDSSSEPPSQSPSLSMDPRPQERWSFWDTHLSHPSVLHAYILQHTEKTKKKNASHFPLFISVAVIIISVWFCFCIFIFYFNAFLLNHVHRHPNRRLNSQLRSARSLLFFFFAS